MKYPLSSQTREKEKLDSQNCEDREQEVAMGALTADIKANSDFLSNALKNRKSVTAEGFRESMKFNNSDYKLSDVLADAPLDGESSLA